MKTVILLINVGTPEKPDVEHVRRYLSEFLNDKYVVDLPWLTRKLLVNLIIVPFRAPKSAHLYQKLWTDNGSPLFCHLHSLTTKIQQKIPDNYTVFSAMRYGNPSVKQALEQIKKKDVEKIIVVPLYPQYALSTTESAKQHVLSTIKKLVIGADVHFLEQFYNAPPFIRVFSEKIKSHRPETFDHVVFSYHGLPIRQVKKIHPEFRYEACNCTEKMPAHGTFCYKAACYETTRLLTEKLSIPKEKHTTAFQSRLSRNWLQPFTDDVLLQLLAQGKKKILVAAPSFVADCLETTHEIGIEYRDMFLKNGGTELKLVESLNDSENWADALIEMVLF